MRAIRSRLPGLGVLVGLLAAGCATRGPVGEGAAPAGTAPDGAWRAYRTAVRDAAVAEAAEVRHDLVAITQDDDALEWRQTADGPQLLVVTWSGWDGYLGQEGNSMSLGAYVWITVAHQVQERCRGFDGRDLQARLEQLLGLPPGSGAGRRFVEMWAAPGHLFRPCADTEIDDATCGLTADGPSPDPELTAFLWNQTVSAYHTAPGGNDPGYPWTRLGYTYDWGPGEGEVGLSEFVVRKGSEVEISRVEETADYCG